MRHHIFLFQIISFKKYFYVFLGNIFTVFVEAPLVVKALGNCPVCPPLNPALNRPSLLRTNPGRTFKTPAKVSGSDSAAKCYYTLVK